MEEPVVNLCGEVPESTSENGLQRWTKVRAEGAADEGWSPSDSAASLHKSRQGRKPLQTEPAHGSSLGRLRRELEAARYAWRTGSSVCIRVCLGTRGRMSYQSTRKVRVIDDCA